jgi:hypothetical protein
MGRASEWRLKNDRALHIALAEQQLSQAEADYAEHLARPQVYVLEGKLQRTHYRDCLLDSAWIQYWLRDTLPELRSGRRVRITIEEIT